MTVPASVARSNQAAKAFSLIFDFSLIVIQELVKGGEELEGIKRRCCRCLCLLYAGTLEPRFRAAFLTCLHPLLLLGETTRFYKPHWVSHTYHAASKHVRMASSMKIMLYELELDEDLLEVSLSLHTKKADQRAMSDSRVQREITLFQMTFE